MIVKKFYFWFCLCFTGLSISLSGQCVQGNCREGKGTFKYSTGAAYTGTFLKGQPHGQGIMISAGGHVYEGDWYQGQKSGIGKIKFKTGASYIGQFKENHIHGIGTYYFANGDRFEGMFEYNSPNGLGQLTKSNGSLYSGLWENGKLKSDQNQTSPTQTTSFNTPSGQNIYLLIVGISRYENFKTLKYSDDDAYRIYAFFKSPEGGAIPEKNIRILIDESATKENIYLAMDEIAQMAGPEDVILCYFAGHGLKGYFLPVDSDGYRRKISYHTIQEYLNESTASKKIFMADACFSGSLLASREAETVNIEKFYQALFSADHSTAFLLSSKEEEFSKESSGLRQGIFSYYLIQGLQGRADRDNNQMVTIEELYHYIQVNVRDYTKNEQNPILIGEYTSEFPLSWVRNLD